MNLAESCLQSAASSSLMTAGLTLGHSNRVEHLCTPLRGAYRGGEWFESMAAHQRLMVSESIQSGGSTACRSRIVMLALFGAGNPTETIASSNSSLDQRLR